MKFKLNETYQTKGGLDAKIIAIEEGLKHGTKDTPVIALITGAKGTLNHTNTPVCYCFSEDGKYVGIGNTTYDIVSNDPSVEEQALIDLLKGIPSTDERDRDEAMLKAIRQLRKR